MATVDTNLQGRDGDAADKKKIWTTATEKEKERATATRWTAIAPGGVGAKTTTMEAEVATTAVAGRVDTGAATTMTTATMVTAVTFEHL
jgi:hypothetical protein